MASIEIHRIPGGEGAIQLLINGTDYSLETFRGLELVEVGDDPATAEVGLTVTFAVSRLTIDDSDIRLTGHLREAAAKVRSVEQVRVR